MPFMLRLLMAIAAVSLSLGTSLGVVDERAGPSTAPTAAATNATT